MDLLRALGTFVRIVETGSFSAVARESNSSSSAVARLVGQLEDHFQVRLFHRTTRHLSLTGDGQELLAQVRPILETVSDLEDTLGNHHALPTGRVRIGMTSGAARLMVPGLGDLLARYPGLSIEFVVREVLHDLIEDRLDLGLHLGELADSSVVARQVGAFGRVLVAAPAYLEKRGAPAELDALPLHSCLMLDNGGSSPVWRFEGPGGTFDITVNSAFSSNNVDIVRQAALAGFGVALLPEPAVLDDIVSSRLHRLLPDYVSDRTTIFLVYPSRRHLPPRTRVVIDFIAKRLSALGARLAAVHRDEIRTG